MTAAASVDGLPGSESPHGTSGKFGRDVAGPSNDGSKYSALITGQAQSARARHGDGGSSPLPDDLSSTDVDALRSRMARLGTTSMFLSPSI